MAGKRNEYIGGSAGSLVTAAWGIYSTLTTAKDLPDDAGWIAKMIADPPVYAPWLLFAASVLFIAWVFWRRDAREPDNDGVEQKSTGANSPNLNAPNSHVTINYGPGNVATESIKSGYNLLNADGLVKALQGAAGAPHRPHYPTWDDLPVERDVGLAEALAYAKFGEWGRRFIDAAESASEEANQNLIHFRQLAYDGALLVWGKRGLRGVFVELPSSYWEDHNVNWFGLLRGEATTESERRLTPDGDERFFDLMVSRAQFEREWPHGGR